MAHTALTVVSTSQYGNGVADKGFESVDAANGNKFVNNERTIIDINNGSGGAVVVTVTGPATSRTFGEAVSKTLTVAAGKIGTMGPFPHDVFTQASGVVEVGFDTGASITIAVIDQTPIPR